MIKIEQFLLVILVFIINNNVIRTQFVNYFNATKPYELQISIFVSYYYVFMMVSHIYNIFYPFKGK